MQQKQAAVLLLGGWFWFCLCFLVTPRRLCTSKGSVKACGKLCAAQQLCFKNSGSACRLPSFQLPARCVLACRPGLIMNPALGVSTASS
jgi:hypothetical protein